MKQLRLFIYILIIGFLFGCESETIPSASTNLVGKISTRGSNDIPSLPTGSQALFNAQGGTSVFSFDGNKWNGNQDIFSGSSTEVTALYPAYNGNSLITENPYTSDRLEDVLIAQSTITSEKNIELTFKHLFSKLTIHILSPLKESVNRISLEMPRIEKLNTDGSFSLSETYISTPELNEDGDYTFIIPPTENCNIILSFTIGDQTVSHSLTHTFESGYKYECKIKEPGIYDANDLIEFSKVINGKETTKEWSDFGYIENNDTIYRLLNDIQMTDEESFMPIGSYYKRPFSAYFDGNNHTISGLTICPSDGTLGLFGITTPSSIIKGVHLRFCQSFTKESDNVGSGLGLLVAVCNGTISNCSVTESKLLAINFTSPTGGLVGDARSESNIINCYSHKNNISSSGYLGGIVGRITSGKIINCYSASNTITRKSSYSGGFCGYANLVNITNCYVYNLTLKTDEHRGQFIGHGIDSRVGECYTDTDTKTYFLIDTKEGTCPTPSNALYKSDFSTNSGFIYERLNKWIENNQPSNPIYTLWQEDTTKELPAIFAE